MGVTPDPPDRAQVAFRPPVLVLAGMLGAWGVGRLVPLPFLPDPITRSVGTPLIVLAIGIFVWAVVSMKSGGASVPTSTPTDRLVSSGPYRFSRNPIYLSMLLVIVGTGVRRNDAWFLVAAVACFALLSWGVVSREERYLGRKLGAEYADYRSRVRRWI